MKALRTLLITAALVATATIASAQIVPVTEAGPYKIMRAQDSNVCFAAIELMSETNKPMIYTYYATTEGQRWNVAGYVNENELEADTVTVTVAVDDTESISRMTKTQSGDFLLPFEALPEIEAHEALIKTGEVMSISIDDTDTLQIPLIEHRVALEAMADCIATL